MAEPKLTLDPRAEAEKKLVEALREFIGTQQLPTKDAEPGLSTADVVWFLTAFVCAALAFSIVSNAVLKSDSTKFFVDRILPWFLNLGAISAVIRSPESVIRASRHLGFRWSVVPVLLVLLFLEVPIYKVHAEVVNATLYRDGQPVPAEFSTNLKPMELQLRAQNSGSAQPRTVHLKLGDFFHGFHITKQWRLTYSFHRNLADAMTVCFQPQQFSIDDDFIADTINSNMSGVKIGPGGYERTYEPGGLDVDLPEGQYSVTFYKQGCGTKRASPVAIPDTGSGPATWTSPSLCNQQPSPCRGIIYDHQ